MISNLVLRPKYASTDTPFSNIWFPMLVCHIGGQGTSHDQSSKKRPTTAPCLVLPKSRYTPYSCYPHKHVNRPDPHTFSICSLITRPCAFVACSTEFVLQATNPQGLGTRSLLLQYDILPWQPDVWKGVYTPASSHHFPWLCHSPLLCQQMMWSSASQSRY